MSQVIPLINARICVNCEVIQEGTGNCIVCNSSQVFYLIYWMDTANMEREMECQKLPF
jgi:hypothetical protein